MRIRAPLLHTLTLCLVLVAAGVFSPLAGQDQLHEATPALPLAVVTRTITHSDTDSAIDLGHQFIAAGTDTVTLDSLRTLVPGQEYRLDGRRGQLHLSASLVRLWPASGRHHLRIAFRYFPFTFSDVYARRRLRSIGEPGRTESLRVAQPSPAFRAEEIFGPNLQKSGSIVRGFTVGSNRDLSLNSGLRMQLAGRIASDIEIAASLTDENTPIQPEGTTQTLQEFDKVFVEIKSTDLAATLGDFTMEIQGSEFARLSRKLQGAQGTAAYRLSGSGGSAMVAGAVSRGKFVTNQFLGLESVQGPYRLAGRNGERDIIVIAGTERVYVNGELQLRGETNAYTIDYATGEITFTPRRLITSASRITVDFEYTDRQYARSLFAVQNSTGFWGDRLRLGVSYFREADDPDAPIDLSLTDTARSILAQAGADRSRAVLSGVTAMDSNGFYERVDTLLPAGGAAAFYRYAPGSPRARFNVVFSHVAPGTGDYIRRQPGVFEWRGPGGGEYVPLRFLPLPELQQVADARLEFAPAQELAVTGEFARSGFTANRFSSVPGSSAGGDAYLVTAAYAPRDLRLGAIALGDLDLAVRHRHMGGRFVPIDRTNDIEFARKWGIDSLVSADEDLQEASASYRPDSSISVRGKYGRITRGEGFRSVRNEGGFSVTAPGLPALMYGIESIRSRDAASDAAGSWVRQRGSIAYTLGKIQPGLSYEAEERTLRSQQSALVMPGSFAFSDIAPSLALQAGRVSARAEIGWRTDKSALAGTVARESRSFTRSLTARLSDWHSLTSSLDVTLRTKRYDPAFKRLGNGDLQTVLVRSQTHYSPFSRALDGDLLYEVSTERSSRLQRVYVRVAQGTGNYRYLGDLNGNGLADEDEFSLTRYEGDFIALTLPTDELTPVIDLRTGVRLRFTPARLFPDAASGNAASLLSAVSMETTVRVEEKSTERDLAQVYLLHLSRFQQDSTTIAGSALLTQDLFLFEGSSALSARLRFSQRRGLTSFSGALERAFTRERSARVRTQVIPEIAAQVDLVNRVDRLTGADAPNRVRDLLSNSGIVDIAYRPEQAVEVGFRIELGHATDRLRSPAVTSELNAQSVRWIYAFQGQGQARVELSREEVSVRPGGEAIPFELTSGRVAGKTWLWRLAFEYRVTQFMQTSVNYDGRSEAGGTPVHTMRGEVRAFF